MKKGMLFGLAHREKRVKKINLLHFPVFTSKNFVILKLPEPSTDSFTYFLSPRVYESTGPVHILCYASLFAAPKSRRFLFFNVYFVINMLSRVK